MPKASKQKLAKANLNVSTFSATPTPKLNFGSIHESKLFSEFKIARQVEYLIEHVEKLEQVVTEITTQLNEKGRFNEKLAYSREEVCKIMHTCNATLYNWDKANILRASKVGDKILYSAEELRRALLPRNN